MPVPMAFQNRVTLSVGDFPPPITRIPEPPLVWFRMLFTSVCHVVIGPCPPGPPSSASMPMSTIAPAAAALTVTVNEQVFEFPNESVAVQLTVVVPVAKVEPEAGLQTSAASGSVVTVNITLLLEH